MNEGDIDLNISVSSSDCSEDFFDEKNINKSPNELDDADLLRALQLSFDESLELNELDFEQAKEKDGTCVKVANNHLQKFMQHNLKFSASYKSMENMAKVLNSTPNTSVKVPRTTYLLKKCIPSKIRYEFHIKCVACKNFIPTDKHETICTLCGLPIKTSQCDYFVTMSLKQQLKLTLEKYIDEILAYNESVIKTNGIADLHNARVFSTIQTKYPSFNILPLIINTDGVKVFNSSTDSLWLIQICQAFLPPNRRFIHTNILLVAAHFGRKKPNMHDFFFPVLTELREMGTICILHNGKQYEFLPIIIACCCDLPAKDDVQGMVGFSGYFGCGFCKHPGRLVKGEKKNTVRYIKGDYAQRTHSNFIDAYKKLKSSPIDGIKKISCLIAAENFDLVDGFAIDVMHCVHLGVMKRLMSLWFEPKHKTNSFYINKQQQAILSNKIVCLKPVSEIIRRPRSIFKRGDYKANEYRSLLLYYLPIALDGVLDNRFVKHFRLLSSATYILSKECVSFDDIDQARKQLNEFADSFELLYGKSSVTMNIHLSRHLPNAVANLGPLWCQSAYAFEAKNGILMRSNNSTNQHMVQQLAWKYTMNETLKYATVEEKPEEYQLKTKSTIRIGAVERELFAKVELVISVGCLIIYKNVVMRGVKFSSQNSKEVSTIDYFIRLNDGQIASIVFFTVLDCKLYALIDMYGPNGVNNFHLIKIQKLNVKKVIHVSDIRDKLIYLKFGPNEYVTSFANRFEKT